MNRRFMRYIFVGMISASLVAPAHAVDLRHWFSSLSTTSKNTFYAATAAVIAGLTVLAWKMCSKVSKVHVVPNVPAQPEPVQVQNSGGQAAVPQDNIKMMVDAQVQVELASEQEPSQVQDIKKQLVEIMRLQDEQAKRRKHEDKKARTELKEQAQHFVHKLEDEDVRRLYTALHENNYENISAIAKASIKLWPDSMREQVLKRLEARIEDQDAKATTNLLDKMIVSADARAKRRPEKNGEHTKDKKKAAQNGNGHVQQLSVDVVPATIKASEPVDKQVESKRAKGDFNRHFGLQS